MSRRGETRHAALGIRCAAVVAAVVAAAGCDLGGVLAVDDPDVLPPERLGGPAGAAALRAGALGDFALAYAGDGGVTEGQILIAGVFADEFVHSGSFQSRGEYDRRAVSEHNETAFRAFANLQRARRGLETAARALEALDPGPEGDARIGESWAHAGFAYVLFAEHYCSGVPFSNLDETGAVVYGEPLSTEAMFQRALDRFDLGMALAADDADVEHLARLGRARALLGLGRFAEAAEAASQVPDGFVWLVAYSRTTRDQENGVHAFASAYDQWSVADSEGGNGLPFRTALDPRVPWTRSPTDAVGLDQTTAQYDLLLYPARESPIPLATGDEARYIEAEAALRAERPEQMVGLLDQVRARHGLPGLEDPATPEGRLDLLFRERAFTLFASGHRLGDLRRRLAYWGGESGALLPDGDYFKGGRYGSATALPVPGAERSNPLFQGCFDAID